LLKTVFEVNMKLFANHNKIKKILFVLRDFNSAKVKLIDSYKDKVLKDVMEIYSSADKPEELQE